MATLDGACTSGEPAWNKYILKNPKWSELNLVIEKKKQTFLYYKTDVGFVSTETVLDDGDQLKLLSVECESGYAHVMVLKNGQSGYVPLSKIRKPSKQGLEGTTGDEDKAIRALQDQISKIGILPFLHIPPYTFKNVHTVRKLGLTCKADFVMIGDSEIFVSHKAAGGAKAFQQYAGISCYSGLHTHPEVVNFLTRLTQEIENDKLKCPCQKPIVDSTLMARAIWGKDYGSEYGYDNVHFVGQGEPVVEKVDRLQFSLSFSEGLHVNGNLAHFVGEYEPILGATFRSGRKFFAHGRLWTGARAAIYPKACLQYRNNLKEL